MLEYMRVADDIARRISRGEYQQTGGQIPPEREIAMQYGVAYNTARRAMEELRDRGLIETVWGKGTFVIPKTGA